MSFRLPKSVILRGYRSFSRVLAESSSLSKPPLRLFIRRVNDETTPLRVGFAVARTIRSAVRRNRIRRLMREAFRAESEALIRSNAWRGSEIVLMYVGSSGRRESLSAIRESVKGLLKGGANPQR